ncbi:hypothetical protein Lsed01_01266 [Demequina sediminis]|uniref:Uncharacterized protein n=1 Tax=Demequina sediminis TaxID=1930058 RepID=A0ABP9WG71_9MICO|nr:hypothetical protein [Demequina sediminis]BDZ61460.1 hypothetical protein GCM10025873_12510 [Demequina sediminis]
MADTTTRPPGVTFAVILTWVAAAVDLIGGGALLWLSLNLAGTDLGVEESSLRGYGIALAAIGLLTAAFALGLAAGSQLSRVLIMVLMAARIGGAVYAHEAIGEIVRWQAIGQGIGALLIILMLATPRAFTYFRST